MSLPDWTRKHKEPRTEIKRIKNGFYKYEVAYPYSVERKRSVKKTIRLLGKITEKDGFIPSQKDTLRNAAMAQPAVDIKTFGVAALFEDLMKGEHASLAETFGPQHAHQLLAFAMMRWAHQAPIKRAPRHHAQDFISETWPAGPVTERSVSACLRHVGENRQKVAGWMKTLLPKAPRGEQEFILMDSTSTPSASEHLGVNAPGRGSGAVPERQIRAMYIGSARLRQPVYYRLVNGNITDVKSMALCVREAGVGAGAVCVADKGFYSTANIALLEEEGLSYILPLHRGNLLIDYAPLQQSGFKKRADHFLWQDRVIWHYSYERDGRAMTTFLDETLMLREERDYLQRLATHPETHTREGFEEKSHRFGTLTLIHKLAPQPCADEGVKASKSAPEKPFAQTVYESYKLRGEIEEMFDSYKNHLAADATYMRDRHVLEGWLFANFLAMIAHFRLMTRLREAKLLSRYSPKDILEMSKAIYKFKIKGHWQRSEITEKTRKLFVKIKIDSLT
jgi:hypothetical protein